MAPDAQSPRELWPPARIVLTTPRLQLRLPGEEELARLSAVAADGVHEPHTQPFGIPWAAQPPVLRARSVLQWHWSSRGSWAADRWTLDFAVFCDGEPIGAQGLSATGFTVRREVATGSWLGQRYQRQGFGTEMRAAVLVLAFTQLGALSAVTGAYEDNLPSIQISKGLGYRDDGLEIADRGGARVLARRFRLGGAPDMRRWPAVTVTGISGEFLAMTGATDPAGQQALPLGGYPHA